MNAIFEIQPWVSIACVAILLFLNFIKDPSTNFVGILISFALLNLLSAVIMPNNDHAYYLEFASKFIASKEFFNGDSNISPYMNYLAIFQSLFDIMTGTILLNALLVTSILTSFLDKEHRVFSAEKRIYVFILSLMLIQLFPINVQQSVSANKDFLVIFALMNFFLPFLKIIKNTNLNIKNLTLFHVMDLSKIILAFLIVAKQRPYFFKLMLVYVTLGFLFRFVHQILKTKHLIISIALLTSLFTACVIIIMQTNELKSVEQTYFGRAYIPSIYNWRPGYTEEYFFAPLIANFEGLVGIFLNFFRDSKMSIQNSLIGLSDQLLFLSLFWIYLRNSESNYLEVAFVVSSIFLHFSIQIFGSPNYGAFLRLRSIWIFMLVALVIRKKIERTKLSQI